VITVRRKTFDALLTTGGLVVAIVLLIGGGLLVWGSTFVSNQVHDQLAAQRIFFPEAGSEALTAEEFPNLQKYGSQQVLNGEQAKAYANDFIGAHLQATGGGKTYSELSTASRANPSDTELAQTVQTMFRGETLRGLLLNAYAFGTMATIMMWSAVVAFVAAGLLLLFTVLGFWHLRRTPAEVPFAPPVRSGTPAPSTV
jgi:hypothetical protein